MVIHYITFVNRLKEKQRKTGTSHFSNIADSIDF